MHFSPPGLRKITTDLRGIESCAEIECSLKRKFLLRFFDLFATLFRAFQPEYINPKLVFETPHFFLFFRLCEAHHCLLYRI
jgi:hypothetical protein